MKEKLINYFKLHYQNFFIFITIFLIISPIILSRPLNNLDEIWNYNFARNIADGLIPYRDFNMLQTPLLSMITSIFLCIFGNELIITRILGIFLISFICFFIYKILSKLKINKFYIFCCLFLLFFILKDYICLDYNFANLLFILILIYLETNYILKNESYLSTNFSFHFLIGILNGCCILFKQSTGIFVTLISIFYPILLLKNKFEIKNYFKITFIKMIGIFLPVTLLIIYLIINNAFLDFIDYTILGIKTFTNSISYITLINSNNIFIKITSIFMPIFILLSGIYLLVKKERKLFNFYCYSLASLVVIFPISDSLHFLIGITPFIILFYYLFFKLCNWIFNRIHIKKQKINLNNKIKLFLKEIMKSFITLFFIIYLFISFISLKNYFINIQKNHNIEHYSQIPISEQLLNKINTVNNYILTQNNSVYILDSEAAIYMISINRYNKDFDMLLKGNLGSKNESGVIQKIKQLDTGTKLLIKNDAYSKNWQTPMQVINFVKDNYSKIDTISIFDIYEIN